MKRLNREGPAILGGFKTPARLDLSALESHLGVGAVVVDTRPSAEFATGHVPGTINIPENASFTTWAGWFLPYSADFYLIVDDARGGVDTAVHDLAMIGLDRVGGSFGASVVDEWAAAGKPLGKIAQVHAEDLVESLKHGAVTLLDVRNQNEWNSGHIDGAQHLTLGYLGDRLDEVPRGKPIVVQCAAGGRSSIGASVLKARGFDNVINLVGGIGAWRGKGLPVTMPDSAEVGSKA
jgi:hydroxyacylglutathione hydrolase